MAANQIDSESDAKVAWMERNTNRDSDGDSTDLAFELFERHWRRCLANFERRRLRYAAISCGHEELLYGMDVGFLADQFIENNIELGSSVLNGFKSTGVTEG